MVCTAFTLDRSSLGELRPRPAETQGWSGRAAGSGPALWAPRQVRARPGRCGRAGAGAAPVRRAARGPLAARPSAAAPTAPGSQQVHPGHPAPAGEAGEAPALFRNAAFQGLPWRNRYVPKETCTDVLCTAFRRATSRRRHTIHPRRSVYRIEGWWRRE